MFTIFLTINTFITMIYIIKIWKVLKDDKKH